MRQKRHIRQYMSFFCFRLQLEPENLKSSIVSAQYHRVLLVLFLPDSNK